MNVWRFSLSNKFMRKRARIVAAAAALLIAGAAVWMFFHHLKPGRGKPLRYGKVTPQFMNYGNMGVLLAPDGSLWAWGDAFTEVIKSGVTKYSLTYPLANARPFEVPRRVGTNSDWAQLTGNGHEIYTLTTGGVLCHWYITSNSAAPVRISPDSNWRQISWANGRMLALKTDGSIWSWKNNTLGMPSDGSPTNTDFPSMVGTEHEWRDSHELFGESYAIKNDGTLWLLSHSPPFKPGQVGAQSNWLFMSGYEFGFAAIRADGALWWKSDGGFNREESGVRWTNAYVGFGSVFARKEDGSWWGRGQNRFDTFGLGDGVASLPVMTRLPYDFEAWAFAPGFNSTLLLARDGKLWSWGERMGAGWTPTQLKILAFMKKAAKKFPILASFANYDLDHVPHLIWELPPEVRASLTNDSPPSSQPPP